MLYISTFYICTKQILTHKELRFKKSLFFSLPPNSIRLSTKLMSRISGINKSITLILLNLHLTIF